MLLGKLMHYKGSEIYTEIIWEIEEAVKKYKEGLEGCFKRVETT